MVRDAKTGQFAKSVPSALNLSIDIDALTENDIPIPTGMCGLSGIQVGKLGTLYGGPYQHKPRFLKGIKLAPEVSGEFTVSADIKDFSVPSNQEMRRLILWAIKIMQEDGGVYVGCMAGQGRTGTFIACFLKCMGYGNPVELCRKIYKTQAVETPNQEKFVQDFPFEEISLILRVLS